MHFPNIEDFKGVSFQVLLNFENNVNKETKDLYSDAFLVVNN